MAHEGSQAIDIVSAGPRGRFVVIDEDRCNELLRAHHAGRIAWSAADRLQILPVSYAFDGSIFYRSSPYGILSELIRPCEVVFEVDEIDQDLRSGWSVVVHGRAGAVAEPMRLVQAWQLDGVVPWAPGVRNLFIEIRPDQIGGRQVLADPSWPRSGDRDEREESPDSKARPPRRDRRRRPRRVLAVGSGSCPYGQASPTARSSAALPRHLDRGSIGVLPQRRPPMVVHRSSRPAITTQRARKVCLCKPSYAHGDGCLTQFLQQALDDPRSAALGPVFPAQVVTFVEISDYRYVGPLRFSPRRPTRPASGECGIKARGIPEQFERFWLPGRAGRGGPRVNLLDDRRRPSQPTVLDERERCRA